MISFSSLPMFAGSLAAGITYTGVIFFTTAVQKTVNLVGLATDTVLGMVGGPWIQIPFRIVYLVAQPVAEKTVQTASLGISLVAGTIVGGTVFLGKKLLLSNTRPKKLKKNHKNEEWVVIPNP